MSEYTFQDWAREMLDALTMKPEEAADILEKELDMVMHYDSERKLQEALNMAIKVLRRPNISVN